MENAALNARTSRMALRRGAHGWLTEYGLLLGLVLMSALFARLNSSFLTLENVGTIMEQNAPLLIVSVATTFAIISRNIDLSPASLIALSAVAMGLVHTATGNIALSIAAALVTAVVVEALNGFLIVAMGLSPLIVTLACWIWARGLAISLTGANSIVIRDPFLDFLTRPLFLELSPAVLIALGSFIVGAVVLARTRLGRYTYAMGSDERATTQAGVPVGRYKILMFAMFGVFIGLATVITVGRLGAAAPNAAFGLELDVIVAVIIGGNPFQGGEGNLRRTLIGALFIAVLNNGLDNLGMLDAQIAVYKGASIILALLFSVVSARLTRS